LTVRFEPADLANVRQLAHVHGLTVSEYVRQTALARLRPGVDELGELRGRLERVEAQLERAARGYG
jgi:hypothetical protein